jgi:uncharacterized protein with von Willebrand factor type A (vWA) domain
MIMHEELEPARAFGSGEGISGAIRAFAALARRRGLNVGVQETLEALEAARAGLWTNKGALRAALRALFCCHREELALFDQLFDAFWNTGDPPGKAARKISGHAALAREKPASLVMLGKGNAAAGVEEGKQVSGAHAAERLRRTDFSKVAEIEQDLLDEIARQLLKEMSRRLKRRWRAARRGGPIHLRRTIHRSLSYAGEPMELLRRRRKKRRPRLAILLDISGSMDKYSFFLLRFVLALRDCFRQVEAFTFSTRLERITPHLRPETLRAVLDRLSAELDDWSSGTRIGESFARFNESHAANALAGDAVLLILSDGLDTGEPELLAREMRMLAMRASKIIWLNPLKGTRSYAPTARGMSAALPFVDFFEAAHNLDSLLELEKILTDVG